MSYYEEKYSRKRKGRQHFQENKSQAFRCGHCHVMVVVNDYIGTANRNHCNFCLWSKHVDITKGDRAALCHAGMQPIGLTFKYEGFSKFGEIMLVHTCMHCQKISINRIAGDDDVHRVLETFIYSQILDFVLRFRLEKEGIVIINERQREEVEIQLFGK